MLQRFMMQDYGRGEIVSNSLKYQLWHAGALARGMAGFFKYS